jgi:hypothetical protein
MDDENKVLGFGCFTWLFVFIINATLGGVAVDYILSWFGKDIPVLGDIVIGLFTAQLAIPVAIAGWVLRLCGVF